MTRPSEVKPREGEVIGARYDDYIINDALPALQFSVTPDIVREYASVVNGDPDGYIVDGRKAALPSVLQVYFMAVLYRKYPPQQGGVMGANKFTFHHPIWADETTEVTGTGKIEQKFEKRGRRYVSFSARFSKPDGTLLATALNISHFPE